MNICSDGHEEICHEGHICPVCKIIESKDDQISNLEREIGHFKRKISEQQSAIDGLNESLSDAQSQIDSLNHIVIPDHNNHCDDRLRDELFGSGLGMLDRGLW